MGGSYSAPSAEPMGKVLQDYTKYLPSLMSATSAQMPNVAQQQFNATQATQPLYNALNLQQAQNYAQPLAKVGQDVQRSNALAGAKTNLEQMVGPGTAQALYANQLARAANPNNYKAQDVASSRAVDMLNKPDLSGNLTAGEQNALERGQNQSLGATGNLGLNNSMNTAANAMQFGNAATQRQQQQFANLGQALGAANQTSTSAQNTGFNPINLALGQPNAGTMGNFGTGTFSNTNAGTQQGAAGNAFGFGSNVMGGMAGMNNTATSGAYGLAQANSVPSYIGAVGSAI